MGELVRSFPLSPKCQGCVQKMAQNSIDLHCPAARLHAGSEQVNTAFASVEAKGKSGYLVANVMVAKAVEAGVISGGESEQTLRTLTEMQAGAAKCIGPVVMLRNAGGEKPFAWASGFHDSTTVRPITPYPYRVGPATSIDTSWLQPGSGFSLRQGFSQEQYGDVLEIPSSYQGDAIAANRLANTPEEINTSAGKIESIIARQLSQLLEG